MMVECRAGVLARALLRGLEGGMMAVVGVGIEAAVRVGVVVAVAAVASADMVGPA